MPVRAPVIEPEVKSSDGTDGKTSDAKSASLELRLKEHGHASVRVGSAAMPAPFAFCHSVYLPHCQRARAEQGFGQLWCRGMAPPRCSRKASSFPNSRRNVAKSGQPPEPLTTPLASFSIVS